MRIAITGSTGLIGTALGARLTEAGHEVIAVVRSTPNDREIGWSIADRRIEPQAFDGIDAVVNLAGAPLAGRRWNAAYKREIRDSRIVGTELVASAIAEARRPPRVLVSGSAIGYYGSSTTETFDESSPVGDGFLAALCADWEEAAFAAASGSTRVVCIRTGLVLSADGGALAKQLPLFKFGLGGKFGSGDQWQSWIAIDDHVAATEFLLDADIEGPVNLTAPNPVTNAEFTDALGAALHRPTWLTVPGFGPKVVFGSELVDNLLLSGQRVVPAVLTDAGFEFATPELDGALRAVLR